MIINSFLKDNKKLLFVILAVVLYFNQWVLCVPYMLFYDKQFYNVDLTAAQIITPGIDYDYNKHLNSFEDNRQTVLLIDKINDDSYGTIYGRLYNRKDVNVTCNNQAAIDYHFEIDKENSKINNHPYPLRYYFNCKVFLYPGWNRIKVKLGKKLIKYHVYVKTPMNKE